MSETSLMSRSAELQLDYLPRLPKNRDMKIGCIGSGFIMADCHLVAYRQNGLNPVAIASRSRSNSEAVAERHGISKVYDSYRDVLIDPEIEILDVAVPPNVQLEVILEAVKQKDHIRGILAQKPLGVNFEMAREIVKRCDDAGIMLAVNQNMRYDQSIRACKSVLDQDLMGRPVFASIDMRAIPHWMPWQEELGWATLRTMSIHHLDTFRFYSAILFGYTPALVKTPGHLKSSDMKMAFHCIYLNMQTDSGRLHGTMCGRAHVAKDLPQTSTYVGELKEQKE